MLSLCMLRQRVASKKQVQYKVFDLSVLRVPMYPLYLLFAFLQFFGYVTPIFFIPGFCTVIGISGPNTSAVLSVTAAVNSIGRILAGRLADHWGVLNVLISFNFLSGVMVLAVWLVAKNLGIMMGFGVLWGLFSGGESCSSELFCVRSNVRLTAYWALSVPTSAKIVGMERLGSAAAIQFLMNVIPPIFAAPIGARVSLLSQRSSSDTHSPAYRVDHRRYGEQHGRVAGQPGRVQIPHRLLRAHADRCVAPARPRAAALQQEAPREGVRRAPARRRRLYTARIWGPCSGFVTYVHISGPWLRGLGRLHHVSSQFPHTYLEHHDYACTARTIARQTR